MDVSAIRKDYRLQSLDESQAAADPFGQFKTWFEEAVSAKVQEVNAMVLSTVSKDGRPSGRVVLLKDFNNNGFSFFTNYKSPKGADLAQNPFASLTFFWPELERQIRIEGVATKLTDEESKKYFDSRPWESKVGAWASNQSEIILNRTELENKFQNFSTKFKNTDVPKPEAWGGYRLKPDYFEFWQGRSGRLHDRLSYLIENESWKIARLSP